MVSEIGLGALEIGRDWGIQIENDFGRPSEQEALHLIHAAIDLGINFFDTAPAYQLSEERLGKALKGHRQDVYVATKVGEHYDDMRGFWYDCSASEVRRSIEQSLKRLDTDVIDLLQIHSASRETIERGEAYEVMREFRQQGHIRFIGISGDEDGAVAALEHGGYDTIQVTYNILDQEMARDVFPRASMSDVGVIIMQPLAQGSLTAKYKHLSSDKRETVDGLQWLVHPNQTLSQAALRFVLANHTVSTIIAGTRKIENLRANVAAAGSTLSPADIARLTTA